MKKLLARLLIACSVLALGISATKAAEGWGDNYEKAKAQAKAEHKLLVMDFTGSDWCPWCIKLNKEVFSQPEFKEYAAKNLVLLEVDFPQIKELPANLKAQNDRLQQKYKIEVFPSVLVLNPDGKQIGALGYQQGGAKPFIAELEKLKK